MYRAVRARALALRPVIGIQWQGGILVEDDLAQHRMRLQRPLRRIRTIASALHRQNDDFCRSGREIIRKPDRDLMIGGNGDVQLVCVHDDRRHLTRQQHAGHSCIWAPLGREVASSTPVTRTRSYPHEHAGLGLWHTDGVAPPSTKQILRRLIDELPDDATIDDVQYRLYVIDAVNRGRDEVAAGAGVPHEQVADEMRTKWGRARESNL